MRHPKLILGTVALSLCFVAQTMAQSISGSPHNLNNVIGASGSDLAIPGSRTTGEICKPCHTPHKAQFNGGDLLWNHDVNATSSSYTLYTNKWATANSSVGGSSNNPQLDAVSLLCLSCHDGNIAVDAYGGVGGTTGTTYMQNIVGYKNAIGGDAIAAGATANQVAGYDLSADHPVGVGYPGLSATIGAGGQISGEAWTPVVGYNNPTLPAFTQNGVDGILAVKLVATGGANPLVGVGCGTCHDPHDFTQLFLRMNNTGSALCLKCHNK